MKLRTVIIIVASIYTILFLIGPWYYYGEVKHRAEKGITLKDNINKVISAHWDEQKLKICLQGRIDGESGEIFFELESEKINKSLLANSKLMVSSEKLLIYQEVSIVTNVKQLQTTTI